MWLVAIMKSRDAISRKIEGVALRCPPQATPFLEFLSNLSMLENVSK